VCRLAFCIKNLATGGGQLHEFRAIRVLEQQKSVNHRQKIPPGGVFFYLIKKLTTAEKGANLTGGKRRGG